MAVRQRYIITASSGGDGTTRDLSGSAAAYASMAAMDAGEADDLVAAGDSLVVDFEGSAADTASVDLGTDWTTGASNDVKLRPYAGQEHGGSWNTGVYRLTVAAGYSKVFRVTGLNYLTVIGLQVEQTHTGNTSGGINMSAAGDGDMLWDKILVKKTNAATNSLGIEVQQSTSADTKNKTLVNSVILGVFVKGIIAQAPNAANSTTQLYNNTVVDCSGDGLTIQSNGSAVMRAFNNVVDNSGGNDFAGTAGMDASGGNCSSDATSPETGNRSLTFTFVDKANDDCHLAAGDTGASGKGTDLSSDSDYAFIDDFDGDTRSAWDSGADEKAVAGGDIAATLAITMALAGDLDAQGTLNSAMATSLAFAADLDAAGELTQAVTVALSVSADLSAAGEIACAHAISLAVSADLDAFGSLDAAIPISLAMAADLDAQGNVAMATNLIIALAADIQDAANLAGVLPISLALAADLDAQGSLALVAGLSLSMTPVLTDAGAAVVPLFTGRHIAPFFN